MIIGSFDSEGRPYIQGRLVIPRLGVDGHIDFLVDTGADVTTLHPAAAYTMDLPYNKLHFGSTYTGEGGEQAAAEERAVIIFIDGSKLRFYGIALAIPEASEHIEDLPSLLGQDVLKSWRMVHDKPADLLRFTAKSWDFSISS